MYAVSARFTNAGAKRVVPDTGINLRNRTPRRDRIIEISRKWAAENEARIRREKLERELVAQEKAKWDAQQANDKLVARVGDKPADIIRRTAEKHNVLVSDILGDVRTSDVCRARQEAIAAVYTTCRMFDGRLYTLGEVGRVFGRDHTTILYSLRKLGIQINRKPGYMNWLDSPRDGIGN